MDRPPRSSTARCRSAALRPEVARWNSCRPAAHPPVRLVRAAADSGESGSRKTEMNSSSTSHDRNRRSSLEISCSRPDTRSRGMFISGCRRDPTSTRRVCGRSSTNCSRDRSAAEPAISCRSSRMRMRAGPASPRGIPAGASIVASGRVDAQACRCSARPRWATRVASAASSPVTRYQATGIVAAAAAAATRASRVVFPEPGGATTRSSRLAEPCSSGPSSRARARPAGSGRRSFSVRTTLNGQYRCASGHPGANRGQWGEGERSSIPPHARSGRPERAMNGHVESDQREPPPS